MESSMPVNPAEEMAESFAGRSWDGLHPREQEAKERGRELREERERVEDDMVDQAMIEGCSTPMRFSE
jgi:hypothetical protein